MKSKRYTGRGMKFPDGYRLYIPITFHKNWQGERGTFHYRITHKDGHVESFGPFKYPSTMIMDLLVGWDRTIENFKYRTGELAEDLFILPGSSRKKEKPV